MLSLSARDRECAEGALAAARRAKRHEQRFGPNWHEDEAAVDAISKAIEEVGEQLTGTQSSPGVSAGTRAAHREIPWNQIARTRNILVHGYESKDLRILESIVRDDLPDLIGKLEQLLSEGGG